MQDEKELVLRQINTIQGLVTNKASIMPDSPAHYFMWATFSFIGIAIPHWIGAAVQLTMLEPLMIIGIYLAFMIIVGFFITSKLLTKALDASELLCTPELRIMRNVYLTSLIFATLATLVLIDAKAYYAINGMWIFALGMGMYVENALSKKFFGNIGFWLMIVSFVFLALCVTGLDKTLLDLIGEVLGFIFIPGVLLWLGVKSYGLKR